MTHKQITFLKSCVFVALAGSLFAGCSSISQLTSSWNSNQIAIDGNSSEWGSGLTNLKDTKVFLGVRNDLDYLYICLTSPDQQLRRQLIGAGLSIWFESEDRKRMGVLYPIGMNQGRPPLFGAEGEREPGEQDRVAEQALQDLEVLGPGKDDRNLFSTVQIPGISMKVGGSQGSSVYELKVPLRKSTEHPYAIEATAGSTVKIDIETGKFGPEMRPGGGEGMRGGGRRPRDGGGPPGGGMPSGGMPGGGERRGGETPQGARPEPLDVSVAVLLAGPTAGPER